jgi:hypothetical protein
MIPPDGVHLVTGPLYRNEPFVTSLLALLRGNHLVIMERFDATSALALIERDHVDWMYAEAHSEAGVTELAIAPIGEHPSDDIARLGRAIK